MIHANRLVAHRGYQSKSPENTALGLNQAIEAGALFILTNYRLFIMTPI